MMIKLELTESDAEFLTLCLTIATETFDKHAADLEDHPSLAQQFSNQAWRSEAIKTKVRQRLDGEDDE